jgi:hypothetical protein
MRFMLIATVVAAAAMLFDLRASRAYEGPWCALTNRGRAMVADCSMRTLEMCVQEVIAGNRGFCNPNPRWPGLRFHPSYISRRAKGRNAARHSPPTHGSLSDAGGLCALVQGQVRVLVQH